MRTDDYPPQEPFTEIGARYHEVVSSWVPVDGGIDVVHGENPYQSLSVYASSKPTGDVLCFMHGGGWTNGYKEWMSFMAPALTQHGVTFVTLGYRLAPAHVFPAGFDDCLDGVAWVHDNIHRHSGDPRRIFLGGHSAGAHYAALATLRQDWQAERGLPTNVVRGALPISGTYLFGHDSGLSMRPRFLGAANDAEERASPINYVHAGAAPFLLTTGDRDFPHLMVQCRDFESRLRAAAVEVESMVLNDCDHLGASYASGEIAGQWPLRAAAFMRRA
jgi:arylformamidase